MPRHTKATLYALLDARTAELEKLKLDNRDIRAQLDRRLDTSMMKERIQLCSSLGQLIEATSKAVMFIVGKEVV